MTTNPKTRRHAARNNTLLCFEPERLLATQQAPVPSYFNGTGVVRRSKVSSTSKNAASFLIDPNANEVSWPSWTPKKTGIYYVTISNCGLQQDPRGFGFSKGEVTYKTARGYLPGEDEPKLFFYMALCIA